MKNMKKQQEKKEQLRRKKEEERAKEGDQCSRDQSAQLDDSDESIHDFYEVIQMKKNNQKFSKLMSFDIEQSLNKTQDFSGKFRQSQNVSNTNNLSAIDNMRLN